MFAQKKEMTKYKTAVNKGENLFTAVLMCALRRMFLTDDQS